MPSATIKIFLAHGDPKRLRTAEISNWTGKAVAGPRTEFEDILKRDEASNAGVYLLKGNDPETGKNTIYVGEAETIRDRVKNHSEKDYWNHIIIFISKDETLTKSHIRYLEGRLIELLEMANRSVVKNAKQSGSKLPESDREDMEIFLEKMIQLLPALGVEDFIPQISSPSTKSEHELLICEIHKIKASGRLTPNGIVVLKNSQAVLEERASVQQYPWIHNYRKRLVEEGTLIAENGFLRFVKDAEFASPSAAAAVVVGGTANGRTAWRNEAGRTLKELEAT